MRVRSTPIEPEDYRGNLNYLVLDNYNRIIAAFWFHDDAVQFQKSTALRTSTVKTIRTLTMEN